MPFYFAKCDIEQKTEGKTLQIAHRFVFIDIMTGKDSDKGQNCNIQSLKIHLFGKLQYDGQCVMFLETVDFKSILMMNIVHSDIVPLKLQ